MSTYHKDPEFALRWPDFLPDPHSPYEWILFLLALLAVVWEASVLLNHFS